MDKEKIRIISFGSEVSSGGYKEFEFIIKKGDYTSEWKSITKDKLISFVKDITGSKKVVILEDYLKKKNRKYFKED